MFWPLWVSGRVSKISIASLGAHQAVRRTDRRGHKRWNNLNILCELRLTLGSLCFGTLSLRRQFFCYSPGAIFKQLHYWNRIVSDINNPVVVCWNTAWAVLVQILSLLKRCRFGWDDLFGSCSSRFKIFILIHLWYKVPDWRCFNSLHVKVNRPPHSYINCKSMSGEFVFSMELNSDASRMFLCVEATENIDDTRLTAARKSVCMFLFGTRT